MMATASMTRRDFLHISCAGALAIASALAFPQLVGCSAPQEHPSAAVSILVQQTMNSAHVSWRDGCFREVCDPISLGGGTYSVYGASSMPEAIASGITVEPTGNPEGFALTARYEDGRMEFAPSLSHIDSYVPPAEEVDMLASIRMAAGALSSGIATKCESHTLVIVGNGISTYGVCDMRGATFFDQDIETWIDELRKSTTAGSIEAEAMPDLSGTTVVWYGCGRMSQDGQKDLPDSVVARLKNFYKLYFEACCVESIEFRDWTPAGTAVGNPDYPKVTAVPFGTATFVLSTYDANVVAFKPYSDQYADDPPAEIRERAIREAAMEMASGDWLVVGTTATEGAPEGARKLSLDRAHRFASDLVSQGVNPSRIDLCGAGYEATAVHLGPIVQDLHWDECEGGDWDEEVAKLNRACHIVPAALGSDLVSRFGSIPYTAYSAEAV